MTENLIQSDVKNGQTPVSAEVQATILIHGDDTIPYELLVLLLQTVFELSQELAEHIASITATQGSARVVTRSRSEAEELTNMARAAALLNGFPLMLSLEQNPHSSTREWRYTIIRCGLCTILLLCAVSLAIADGAGGITFYNILAR